METFRKRDKVQGEVVAAYTLYLLVGAHCAVFLAAWHEVGVLPPRFTAMNCIAIIVVVAAAIGRFYSVKTLGVYHSIHIEIRRDHPLISDGPYFFVRNPYYLSNAVEVVGFPLMVNSFLGAGVAMLLYWPCLYLRVVLEERALLEAIKAPFADYMRRVPRFFPIGFRVGASI
ncbi:MAG: methyltransferase family protein [Chloroflexota bacterium]